MNFTSYLHKLKIVYKSSYINMLKIQNLATWVYYFVKAFITKSCYIVSTGADWDFLIVFFSEYENNFQFWTKLMLEISKIIAINNIWIITPIKKQSIVPINEATKKWFSLSIKLANKIPVPNKITLSKKNPIRQNF